MAILIRHWPELEEVVEINRLSVLGLLERYGDPAEVRLHEQQALALLHKIGRVGLKNDKCRGIIDSAKNTIGVVCLPRERQYIQHLATDLIRTIKASQTIEKQMANIVEQQAEMTEVAHLTGKTTCIVLSALLGDLRNYPNAHSLLKATGLNL